MNHAAAHANPPARSTPGRAWRGWLLVFAVFWASFAPAWSAAMPADDPFYGAPAPGSLAWSTAHEYKTAAQYNAENGPEYQAAALVTAPDYQSSRVRARAQNSHLEFFGEPAKTHRENLSQVAKLHQEEEADGGKTVLGRSVGSNGDPASLHKYNYGYGNPVTFMDPSGHMPDVLLALGVRAFLTVNLVAPAITVGLKYSAYIFAVSAVTSFSTALIINSVDDVPDSVYDVNELANETAALSGTAFAVFSMGSTMIIPPSSGVRNNFRGPNQRHYIRNVKQNTWADVQNTMIEPTVSVADDVAAINAGRATRVGNTFVVNGRVYGIHSETGTIFPMSGAGFHSLDRGGFKALGVYNKFGDTPGANKILDNMGVSAATRAEAFRVYLLGKAGGE